MKDLNKEIRARLFFLFAISSLCTLSFTYLQFYFDYDRVYVFTTRFDTPHQSFGNQNPMEKLVVLEDFNCVATVMRVAKTFSLCAVSLILLLMLLSSIKGLVKLILLKISLSDEFMTITIKERNRKLVSEICLLTTAISLLSGMVSAGITYGLKSVFGLTIYGYAYHPVCFGAGLLLISVTTGILLCFWIVYKVPSEPITTYLTLKKQGKIG